MPVPILSPSTDDFTTALVMASHAESVQPPPQSPSARPKIRSGGIKMSKSDGYRQEPAARFGEVATNNLAGFAPAADTLRFTTIFTVSAPWAELQHRHEWYFTRR